VEVVEICKGLKKEVIMPGTGVATAQKGMTVTASI
jgi:hypothetical protein